MNINKDNYVHIFALNIANRTYVQKNTLNKYYVMVNNKLHILIIDHR